VGGEEMVEVKKYLVSIDTRDVKGSDSFHINGDEEFTMNGKTYKFQDITRIMIADADGNGGWNSEDAEEIIKGLSSKGKK
jgi:hypothetical protein